MAEGIGPNTLRLEFALVSHLFEVARKEWGMETLQNPIKAFRKPRLPPGRDRRLEAGEEAALLAHCRATSNLVLEVLITVAVETAMRRRELVKLDWAEVNLARRMVRLRDTKNGRPRVVPLSTRAVAALQRLTMPHSGSVFGMGNNAITVRFGKACKACRIVGLTFHDLRHEATSRLFEKGLSLMEAATITGHQSLQMLQRYTHLRPSDLLNRLG